MTGRIATRLPQCHTTTKGVGLQASVASRQVKVWLVRAAEERLRRALVLARVAAGNRVGRRVVVVGPRARRAMRLVGFGMQKGGGPTDGGRALAVVARLERAMADVRTETRHRSKELDRKSVV